MTLVTVLAMALPLPLVWAISYIVLAVVLAVLVAVVSTKDGARRVKLIQFLSNNFFLVEFHNCYLPDSESAWKKEYNRYEVYYGISDGCPYVPFT